VLRDLTGGPAYVGIAFVAPGVVTWFCSSSLTAECGWTMLVWSVFVDHIGAEVTRGDPTNGKLLPYSLTRRTVTMPTLTRAMVWFWGILSERRRLGPVRRWAV